LIRELDGLPLAIATAGAYLYQVSTSFADYLELYKASWLRLQQNTPQLFSYEDRALYSTWGISLDHVKQQSLLAFKLLQLLAYFDNQDVWFELLQEGRQDGPEWFSQLMHDRLSFENAVRLLCEHALVEANVTFQDDRVESLGYSMHSCVHSWTVHVVNQGFDATMGNLALECVGRHMPDGSEHDSLVTERRIMPHVRRSWEFIVNGSLYSDGRKHHLHRFGDAFANQGRLDEAEKMYQRALLGFEKAWGPEHTSTLAIVNNLAVLYGKLGRLDEAEKMYQRALQGYEKAWGPEHTTTLRTVNNLGLLYADLGRLNEAEKMYQRALQGKEKAWGPEHKSTLDTVNNLGLLYADLGRLNEAEKMYQRALQGKEKVWGLEHISTLNTVNNLGLLYADLGRLDEAEQMYQRALQGKEKAWGPEHKSTLNTVNNLGVLYGKLGRLDEAEKMCQRALTGYEKRLGYEHKKCCSIRQALATMREGVSVE
jgi:tetratricopeptide (TPR) repeat protein